jgi:LytS/YehU family sensor histidine kinase
MIKLEERNLARKYLIGFSKFIRAALEQSKKSNMNLHEEIESLHQFLELESTRLNGNFSFQLDAQNENKHLNAEPIMLQQIFEILIELIECKSKDNPCKMNIRFNGHSHIEFTVEIIASKQIGEWIVQEGLRRYQLLSLAKNIRTRLMKAECIENKLLMSFEPK